MDSYTVGTVVIFCSITWIIASPFVVFYYHKRYITAYRELEELRREVSPAVDIQSTQMSASEGAQSTNKQPITENRSNPATPLSDHELLTKIRSMSPYDFEKYIAQLFEHFGYSAATTPYKRDGGIDIVLYKNGVQSYVQCKKYIKQIVKVSEVRDFYGAVVDHLHGGDAFFVTTNIFSSDARRFVKYSTNGNKIRLIDNTGLLTIIRALEDKGVVIPIPDVSDISQKIKPCPRCRGGHLVIRHSKNNHSPFYGCSNYPECRYMQKIDS